jgi:hypothetical protein
MKMLLGCATALLLVCGTVRADEMDREVKTKPAAAKALAGKPVVGSELDKESPEQSRHWRVGVSYYGGGWGGYASYGRPWGGYYGGGWGGGYYSSYYTPVYYPTYYSYGYGRPWGGYYGGCW